MRFLRLFLLVLISSALVNAEDAAVSKSTDSTPAPAAEVSTPPSWRDRYTLGPGDILDFSLYGQPDLDRSQVFIRPDGHIGYLQATDVVADGLTIDELRAKLETILAEFHQHPRVVITPVELRSKRYVILGKVVDKGIFALEHPITLIEAVARSRGVETGLFEGNTVELADLPRSFIVRANHRLPVDFEKLFFEGDLAQNVQVEPGDFIYFASAISNDVYVLGEISQPGVLGFTSHLTALGAITARGSFSSSAYRGRVLIVRGSLQKPEIIVVNVNDILAGKTRDVLLQPKDIVYVSRRPWIFAEELVDTAINTFLSSMTSSWTDRNLGPWLPGGSIPQVR
jgi:protein involved in polysaccharide export with SLBB domain